jgi:hypothetical protein
MAYPSTFDTYTPVAGTTLVASAGHAAMHNVVGSAVVALEAVVGTNTGTNVMKDFTVGKFAVYNSGGTLNAGVLGTPMIRGGTVGTTTIGTSNIVAGSVGTALIRGGTVGTATIGTCTITGGTVSAAMIGTCTLTGGSQTSLNVTTGSINQVGAADNITLTPGTEKVVKFASIGMKNGTTVYWPNTIIQSGYGFMQGTAGISMTEQVNMPWPFGTTDYTIMVTPIGYKADTDPTSVIDISVGYDQSVSWTVGAAIASAGAFAVYFRSGTSTFVTANRYMYYWMAIGTV